MSLRPFPASPHGPRFTTKVTRGGDSRQVRVTTSYEEWGDGFWGDMTALQQQHAHVDLQALHAARCNLESLDPNWRDQASNLLRVKGFGPDWAEHPSDRPDLHGPRARTVVLGWAIVESGYALGQVHFEPRGEHPALVAFAALGI